MVAGVFGAMEHLLTAEALDVDAGQDAVEFCYEQGWTDGLPVVPPR